MKTASPRRLVRRGSRAARILTGSVSALLAASAQAAVLQADNFNDNSFNTGTWKKFTPTVNSYTGTVTEASQVCAIVNRGYLVTVSQWDPTNAGVGGLHLAGTWKFNQGSAGSPETLQILTRSTGTGTGSGSQETSGGIEFRMRNADTVAAIQSASGNGSQFTFSSPSTQVGTLAAAIGDTFAYDIWDFGDGKLAFSLTGIAGVNVGKTATLTATLATNLTTSTNYITYHDRERANNTTHGAILDDLVIAAPSSWTGTTDSTWTGANWTAGGNNPSGNGVSVVFGKAGAAGSVTLDDNRSVGAVAFYPDVNTTLATATGMVLTLDNQAAAADGGSGLAGVTVLGGQHSINAGVTLNSGAMVSVLAGSDSLTLGGNLGEGSAGKGIVKGGAGTLVLTGSNTYSGTTRIALGTLAIGSAQALQNSTVDLNSADAGSLQIGTGITAASFGGLTGSHNLALLNVDNSGVALTVGNNNANTSYGGILGDTGGATAGQLTKVGTGTLTLTGANSYTGPTTISGGTLALGVGGSIAASPTIFLGSDATFSVAALGTGYHLLGGQTLTGTANFAVTGTMTVDAGATVLPGGAAGIGNLTVGSLNLSAASILKYDFGSGVNDLITVSTSGGLNLAGGGIHLYQADGATPFTTPGIYNLMQYSGTLAGSPSNLSVLDPGSNRGYVFDASGGFITLTITSLDQIWNGGGNPTFTWSNHNNWGSLLAPVNGKTLTFAGTMGLTNTNNIANLNVAGMAFTSTAGAFNLSGNSIQLSGAIINSSSATQTIAMNLALVGDSQSLNALSGNLVVNGTISDGDGSRGIVKAGAGTLTLTANNSYSGGTTLNFGTLLLGHNNALGSGPLTINAGAVSSSGGGGSAIGNAMVFGSNLPLGDFTNNGPLAFSGPVTIGVSTLELTVNSPVTLSGPIDGGSNGLTKLGTAVLTLSGSNLFTGTTTVSDGTLQLNSAGIALAGNLAVAGGVVELLQSNQIDATKSVSVSSGSLAIGGNSNTLAGLQLTGGEITGGAGLLSNDTTAFDLQSGVVSARLGGSVGLLKSTAGTVVLSGTSSYGGATAITGGLLQLGVADALPAATAVTLSNSAGTVLDLNGFNQTIGSLAGGSSSGGGVTLNGATLTVGDATSTVYGGTISGAGPNSGLTKQGDGMLTLTSWQSYEGATLISGGTLQLAGMQTLLSDTLLSSTLDGSKWTTNTSSAYGGASVTPTTNGFQVKQRGYLNTAAQFDPTQQVGGLHVTGNWKITAGQSTASGHQEFMQIDTRSTGTPSGNSGEVSSGVEFRYAMGNAFPQISGYGSFTVGTVTQTGGLINNMNDVMFFDILDDGRGGLSITLTDLTTNTSATATATLLTGSATANFVTFHDREQTNDTSLVSNVVISNGGGGSNLLPITTPLTVAALATLDLGGVDQQVASLAGAGTVSHSIAKDVTLTLSSGVMTPTPDFSGGIIDGPTNSISLVKAGLGTQVLSGANSYSGTTTVRAGTLALGAAGSISNSSGVILAPGALLDTSAKATFAMPAWQTFTIHLDGTASGSSGRLHAAALNISNAVVVLTVDNPLDDAAYVLADYASLTGGTFASVAPPLGYSIDYAYNSGTQIALVYTGISAYDAWANAFTSPPLTNTTAGADPDHDGRSNLAEFAFDGDPRSGVNDGKVVTKVATLTDASRVLTLTLPVRDGAIFSGATEQVSALIDGVIYAIQGSATLDAASWTLVVSEVTGADATAIQSGLPTLSAGWSYRTFRSPGTVTHGDPHDFLRAKVVQP